LLSRWREAVISVSSLQESREGQSSGKLLEASAMRSVTIFLLVFFLTAGASFPQGQSSFRLTAPTYFIAAHADYRGSDELWIRGTSNLPAGAILIIDVQNYIGEDSQIWV
jgi:hypothetical protein